MLIEIVKHTPPWVFVIFLGLLALGYTQSKDREIGRSRVLILPAAMIALSFYGVLSAFGFTLLGLTIWLLGVAASVAFGLTLALPRGVIFSAKTNSFQVPGSWLPLGLMMAIFFTKYAVGVVLAKQVQIANEGTFVNSIIFCYGLFSGLFLARALVILQAAMIQPSSQ